MTVTLPYDGVLDEWGLWDRVMTDAEAAERYNNGFGSTATGGSGNAFTPTTPSTPATPIPHGDTASRPATALEGQLYFNTETDTLEYWDGTDWLPAAAAVGDYILKSIVDAKGDVLAGTADNTIARVAVGSDGKVLTADSGATEGVSWQTPSGGAPSTAHYVTSQAESGLSAELVLGTDVIMAGTFASLPAASIAGRLYFATDAAGGRWYRDTGATWVQTTKGLSEMIGLALIAAKGDLIAGTGAGAVTNVTVGTNGYLLKADSGATPGVSWVDPAGVDTGAIPKSLVDVKGDIIAATADNTVARKAAGTDGTFLRPKAANSDGLEWYDHEGAADPHPVYVLESLFDAKGDLLAASADNTPSKVTVGVNGKVLTADSTATGGVSWQDASSGVTSSIGNKLYLATHYN